MLSNSLAAATEATLARLNGLIQEACAGLDEVEANQLRVAARRSIRAMVDLRSSLAGSPLIGMELGLSSENTDMPLLNEETARHLLEGLRSIKRELDRNVLQPAEREMQGEQIALVRRLVGWVWGWMASDLQDPLWKRYPDLAL
jgi:hypothetical protein